MHGLGERESLVNWFSDNELTRGTQFEKLMCWWLTASPTLSTTASRLTKVIRWSDWAERPSVDLGTDLVGWDTRGRLWAIQCKAYAPTHLVHKSEVAQLVGDAPTGENGMFHGRIFVTTSDGYTKNAKTIAQRNNVLLLARDDLDSAATSLPWPKSERALNELLHGKTVKRRPRKPRPHQKHAVQQVTEHLAAAERAQLFMACGTGKTLTALWIKERLLSQQLETKDPRRVVVLLPSISLLAQTRSQRRSLLRACSGRIAG